MILLTNSFSDFLRDIIFAALMEFMVYRGRQTLILSQNCFITNLISTVEARSGDGALGEGCSREAAFELRPRVCLGLQEKNQAEEPLETGAQI